MVLVLEGIIGRKIVLLEILIDDPTLDIEPLGLSFWVGELHPDLKSDHHGRHDSGQRCALLRLPCSRGSGLGRRR